MRPSRSTIEAGFCVTADLRTATSMTNVIENFLYFGPGRPYNNVCGSSGLVCGSLGPVCGSLGPVYGSLGPVFGSLGPVFESLGPVFGSLGPVRGSLGPVCGSLGPVYGSLGPVYGSLGPGRGSLGPVRVFGTRVWLLYRLVEFSSCFIKCLCIFFVFSISWKRIPFYKSTILPRTNRRSPIVPMPDMRQTIGKIQMPHATIVPSCESRYDSREE